MMGNTHDTEIARIEADYIKTKYRSQGDYRWGYTGDRGTVGALLTASYDNQQLYRTTFKTRNKQQKKSSQTILFLGNSGQLLV